MKRLISASLCPGILRRGTPIAWGTGAVNTGMYVEQAKEGVGRCLSNLIPRWYPFPFEKVDHNDIYLRADTSTGFTHAVWWLAERVNMPHPTYARFYYDSKQIVRSLILSSGQHYLRFVPFDCEYIGDVDNQRVVEGVFDTFEDSVETMLCKICESYASRGKGKRR